MPYRSSLTSLRFIAAYLVVGLHFFKFPPEFNLLNGIFSRGYLGVDFFFILSGFVMALRYDRDVSARTFSPRTYLLHRFQRIAPAYYLSLLLSLPMLLKAINEQSFLGQAKNLGFFIVAHVFFLQSLWPAAALLEGWNLPAWSLSAEIVFYLMFPILAVPLLRKSNPIPWLLGCFLLHSAFYVVTLQLPQQMEFLGQPSIMHWPYSPVFRFAQFILGTTLYMLGKPTWTKDPQSPQLIIFALLSAAIFVLPLPATLIQMGSPLAVVVFAGLIYYCAQCDRGAGLLNNAFLVALGNASYALYILQVPLKVLFQQIYSKVLHLGDTEGFLYCAYLSVTLLAASYLAYRFFELPIDRYLRQKRV